MTAPAWAVRRHPGAKLLLLAGATTAVVLSRGEIVGILLVLALGVALAVAPRTALRLLPWLALGAAFTVALVEWAGPGSREGLLAAGRASTALLGAVAFAASTPPRQIVILLRPFPRLALAAAATHRLMPSVEDDYATVRDARCMRGYDAPRGLAALAGAARLLPPVLVRSLRRGRTLGLALKATGYGSRRRVYARAHWMDADTTLALAGAALAAAPFWPYLAGWLR